MESAGLRKKFKASERVLIEALQGGTEQWRGYKISGKGTSWRGWVREQKHLTDDYGIERGEIFNWIGNIKAYRILKVMNLQRDIILLFMKFKYEFCLNFIFQFQLLSVHEFRNRNQATINRKMAIN